MKSLYKNIFQSINLGIIQFDSNLTINEFNEIASIYFNLSASKINSIDTLIPNISDYNIFDLNDPEQIQLIINNKEITVEIKSFKIGDKKWVLTVEDISLRLDSEKDLYFRANFDVLTELPNRSLFNDRVLQALANATRQKTDLAIMFLDLDDFKSINDTHGHNGGDILLIETANRILSCVRETDTVSRWAGDEFTLLLTNINDQSNLEMLSERIIKKINKPVKINNKSVLVTCSIGISQFPVDGGNIERLLELADKAMYEAKNEGKNKFRFYS